MQRPDVSGATASAGKAVADLGVLDGPVLVFGGPYSNLEATEAMLATAAARGIPPERIVCTGDVVAYCADPEATVRAVREAGVHAVMGNCEESLARGVPDCGCGFAAGSACQRLSEQWYAYAKGQLSAGARRWMAGLPRQLRFGFGGRRFAVVHGSASSINRFIFASTPAAEKAAEIAKAGVDAIIGGHSGLPFSQLVHGGLWHNAGAVGLPANDGTRRVWYSILHPESRAIVVEHHSLEYDHRTAGAKMRAHGLPEEYTAALETGLWPSCDILPQAERAVRGKPLKLGDAVWSRAEVPGV